jgi:hypothetical protein
MSLDKSFVQSDDLDNNVIDQKGKGINLYSTDDGRIIYVRCNPTPSVAETTKTKSISSNYGGIGTGTIQKISSSSLPQII